MRSRKAMNRDQIFQRPFKNVPIPHRYGFDLARANHEIYEEPRVLVCGIR
jgi:hypothetical protein